MVKMLRQQRREGKHRPFLPLQKQPGDGSRFHKDPSRPDRQPTLQKEPRPTRDRDRRFDWVPNRVEAQESLVPVGWGFYGTPSEPANPRDCDRWPNSIWCSGLFSPDIRDLPGVLETFSASPFAVDVEVVADECNVGISISPYAFWTALSTQQLVWRREECRLETAKPFPEFDPDLPPDYSHLRPIEPGDVMGGLCVHFDKQTRRTLNRTPAWQNGELYAVERETFSTYNLAGIYWDTNKNKPVIGAFYIGWESAKDPRPGKENNNWRSDRSDPNMRVYDLPTRGPFVWAYIMAEDIDPPVLPTWNRTTYDHVMTDWIRTADIMTRSYQSYCYPDPPKPYPPVPPPYPFPAPVDRNRKPPMACSCPSPRNQRAILEELKKINQKLGNWPISVAVEDMLPLTEGKQPYQKQIPDLATAVTDVWENAKTTDLERDVQRESTFRTLLANKQIYLTALRNGQKLDALVSHFKIFLEYRQGTINLHFNSSSPWRDPGNMLRNTQIVENKAVFDPERKENKENGSLEEILEILEELKDAIGDGKFEVPSTLISTENNPIPSNIKIENLTAFQGYLFERLDELFGQWDIPIEIDDMEPFIEGKQSKVIRLPNLAEAVGEIWAELKSTKLEQTVHHQTSTRALVTSGQNFQIGWQNQMKLDAIISFLGFAYKEKTEKIPFFFNPLEKNGDAALFLQNTEVDAVRIVFDPKQKRNLQTDLLHILHGAAILKAVFWRPVDNNNPEESIKKNVEDLLKNQEKLSQLSQKQREELREWLEKYSQGFPDYQRETDGSYTEDFWDVSYNERPILKDITGKIVKKEKEGGS